MARTRIWMAVIPAVALLLTACQTGSSPAEPGDAASARPPFQTTTPGAVAPSGTPTDVPEARWAAIEADLAARDVAGTPTLISAEAVTFTDGSLGCAEPGMSYTQALVDGMRVVVEVDGTTYDYRFGGGDEPHLCER